MEGSKILQSPDLSAQAEDMNGVGVVRGCLGPGYSALRLAVHLVVDDCDGLAVLERRNLEMV